MGRVLKIHILLGRIGSSKLDPVHLWNIAIATCLFVGCVCDDVELCAALQDEAGVLQDVYDSQQRGIANAKSHLSIVSTLLVGWAVIITVAVLILLVVAFTRLRRSRLFDVTDVQSSVAAAGIDVASWSCDAEAGLPASSHQPARPSTVLESDMEPDDLPVDMSRLSTMCSSEDKQQSLTGAVVSEDELNTRDIPRFVHTTATSTST